MSVNITEWSYSSVIQEIARLVGHPRPTDPAGSTDPAVQQMGAAVNFALEELLTMSEWQDLTTRASLSVVADSPGQVEKAFSLPDDFYRFVDQSQWSSASNLPAGGPVSNQMWMQSVARAESMQLTLYWQMRGDQIYFLYPPHPTSVTFDYMYLSTAQVQDADTLTEYKNRATKNGDAFLLDGFMIMLLARARYLEWKGFDAGAAVRDFLNIFNSRAGASKGAPVITLAPSRFSGVLLHPVYSLPNTGYGS